MAFSLLRHRRVIVYPSHDTLSLLLRGRRGLASAAGVSETKNKKKRSTPATRYLIVDGYAAEGREELEAGGASPAHILFDQMLQRYTPGPTECDVLFPSDPGYREPDLHKYHGVAWTGCSLCIFSEEERVTRQIELARKIFGLGIPQFGSCWAVQIAVAASGGRCAKNPAGREMGFARKIALTPEGRGHPLFHNRSSVFDAFTSHEDEVTHTAPGTIVLAGNPWTRVQAAVVKYLKGEFWGLQYHPEYNLKELARLTYCRREKLTRMGFFRSVEDAEEYVRELEELYENPKRKDLRWKYNIDDDVLEDVVRCNEVINWINFQVSPYRQQKL